MELFYNEQCDKHTKVTHAGVCMLTPKRFLQLLNTRTSTVQAMTAHQVPGKQGALWGLEVSFASTPNGWQRGQGGLNSDQFRPPNTHHLHLLRHGISQARNLGQAQLPQCWLPWMQAIRRTHPFLTPCQQQYHHTLQKQSKHTINLFLQFRSWDIAPKGTPGWAADLCKLKQHSCNLSYAT